ncbi:MAG: hypothetical protein ACK5RK_10735, partial [Betaproteobacteria bacterium]
RQGDALVLKTYGRSSGFCVDPIEKKPLNHFYPGTPVFSFGTAGCNLACKFCQNWDISKSRDMDRLMDAAGPTDIAAAAAATRSRSVAFTYNDPIICAEYALDAGLHYVYTGNVHDKEGGTTFCPSCKAALIVRDWYKIEKYEVATDGHCPHCAAKIAGRFEQYQGCFGPRRVPVKFRCS